MCLLRRHCKLHVNDVDAEVAPLEWYKAVGGDLLFEKLIDSVPR